MEIKVGIARWSQFNFLEASWRWSKSNHISTYIDDWISIVV